MATATSSSHVGTLTPPSSSHGGRGSWDLAVPIQDEGHGYVKHRPTENSYENPSYIDTSQPNGVSRPYANKTDRVDNNTQRKAYRPSDSGHLVPNRVNQLARKHSDTSGTGSEADSLLDLYKNADGRNTSYTHGDKSKSSSGIQWNQDQVDDSNWIHRDKLAQIESRELEEAGFRPRDISRSSSKRAREQSNERRAGAVASEDQHEAPLPHWHDRRGPVVPAIPDEDESPDNLQKGWDLRSSDDITVEKEKENISPKIHAVRPSTSRIPVPKPNAVPSPSAPNEAKSARNRVGSGASNADHAGQGRARTRSGSVGSQVLLDDADESGIRTPMQSSPNVSAQGSPPKAKVPGKAIVPSGTRKPSLGRSSAQPKPRSSSTSSPAKRPGTSGGSSRPPTARPEGEAPWIATMYKPDPSLPPDQQIIPTHAKRLQQEQWEKEGKTGSVYDRDFRILNAETFAKPEVITPEPEKIEIPDKQEAPHQDQWPLPSPSNARPGTSGTEHGGYKTMPTISSSQAPPRSTSTPIPTASSKPQENIRVEEPPEPAKEKKRCCCIVM